MCKWNTAVRACSAQREHCLLPAAAILQCGRGGSQLEIYRTWYVNTSTVLPSHALMQNADQTCDLALLALRTVVYQTGELSYFVLLWIFGKFTVAA